MTAAAAPRARHVGCPACAAPLAFRDGQRTARCPACGGRSLLLVGDGAARERVLANVDAAGAVSLVRSAWAKAPVDPELPATARFDAPEFVLVPLWEVEALQAGLVVRNLGERSVRSGHMVRDPGGTARFVDDEGREIAEHEYYKRKVVEAQDTRVVLRTDVRCGPAGGPSSWRLDAFDLRAMREDPSVRFVPWDFDVAAREASVLPMRMTAADAIAVGGSPTTTDAVARSHDRLAAEVRFVHVPVWLVRCRAGLRTWTYVVDAVGGRILAGRAPETPRRGALTAGVAAAFLGFPIGKVFAAVSDRGAAALETAISVALTPFGVVALFGVLLWFFLPLSVAWSEFRYRGEVDFGPRGAQVVKLARPQTTWIEAAMARTFEALTRMLESREDERARRFPW